MNKGFKGDFFYYIILPIMAGFLIVMAVVTANAEAYPYDAWNGYEPATFYNQPIQWYWNWYDDIDDLNDEVIYWEFTATTGRDCCGTTSWYDDPDNYNDEGTGWKTDNKSNWGYKSHTYKTPTAGELVGCIGAYFICNNGQLYR